MGHKMIQRYTCDRCPEVEEVQGTGQPPGWIGVLSTQKGVPQAVLDGSRKFLCPSCTLAYEAFMQKEDSPA